MANRARKIYRGSWGRRKIAGVAVFILLLLFACAIIAFDSFQKYVVFEPDGLYVELPILATAKPGEGGEAKDPSAPGVTADIIIIEPDFEAVESTAGENLAPVYALSIYADELIGGGLQERVGLMEQYGANALIIEVKPVSGRLVYNSGTAGAAAFDTSGGFDLAGAVSGLKEREIYLIARLSVCVDELTATRNVPVALRDENGAPWSDSDGRYWLDARNRDIRGYLRELMSELAAMGFDEIMLANIALPAVDADESGPFPSEENTALSGAASAVGNLALSLSNGRDRDGVKVSALVPALPDARSGQDLALFLKVFDRVYCPTSAETSETDRGIVQSAGGENFSPERFVPVAASVIEGASWAIGAG